LISVLKGDLHEYGQLFFVFYLLVFLQILKYLFDDFKPIDNRLPTDLFDGHVVLEDRSEVDVGLLDFVDCGMEDILGGLAELDVLHRYGW
jgi:hypothetical protein